MPFVRPTVVSVVDDFTRAVLVTWIDEEHHLTGDTGSTYSSAALQAFIARGSDSWRDASHQPSDKVAIERFFAGLRARYWMTLAEAQTDEE